MFPADLAHLRTPSAPSLAPDGRRVVVAVTRIDLDDNTYRSDLWLTPTDGSAAPRRFTSGKRDLRPRFSPDGRWIAFLRADDEALIRGRAVFETLRVYGSTPFRLDEHLARMAISAERVGLPPLDAAQVKKLAGEALAAANSRDAVLRLFWTPSPTALALVSEVPDHEPLRERGQKLISLRGIRAEVPWLLPGVKSTSYAINMAAEAEAKRRSARA